MLTLNVESAEGSRGTGPPPVPDRSLRLRLLDLIFPPRCVGCVRPGQWICDRCWQRIGWLSKCQCAYCGNAVESAQLCAACRDRMFGPSVQFRLDAVAQFDGTARQAVHELKYKGHTDIVSVLGPLLASVARLEGATLVPVPLHRSRQRSRGFNQAELLARAVARHSGTELISGRLRRIRATKEQIGLDATQRRSNLEGAFTWRGPPLKGSVVVVDDVSTTGATLAACTATLAEAGMRDLRGLVFATRGKQLVAEVGGMSLQDWREPDS